MSDIDVRYDREGNEVYLCSNCNRTVNIVFYVGDETDEPKWACDMCVMSQKRT